MAQHLAGIAVQDAGGADLGRGHLGQVGQRGLDRQQRGLDLGLIGAVDAVEGKAVGGVEGPRPDAAQMRDMAKAAKLAAQIAGDGADIAALAADHAQIGRVRRHAQQFQRVHP